jgi:hypothetical protein
MNPIMGRRAEGLPATLHRPGCDSECFQFFASFLRGLLRAKRPESPEGSPHYFPQPPW